MITIEDLVQATRLAPSVGPFTLRRLFLRARVFSAGPYSATEVRAALGAIREELREILSTDEFRLAETQLAALLAGEDSRIPGSEPAP